MYAPFKIVGSSLSKQYLVYTPAAFLLNIIFLQYMHFLIKPYLINSTSLERNFLHYYMILNAVEPSYNGEGRINSLPNSSCITLKAESLILSVLRLILLKTEKTKAKG